MKRFTDAGRACLASGNLYGALTLALMIPEICGSLEDPGPNKSKARYERWCKKWIEPLHMKMAKQGEIAEPFLPASECYQLRCRIIHSGSANVPAEKQLDIATFAFFDDSVCCPLHPHRRQRNRWRCAADSSPTERRQVQRRDV